VVGQPIYGTLSSHVTLGLLLWYMSRESVAQKPGIYIFILRLYDSHISFPRSVRLAIEGRQHKLGAYFSMHLSRLCPSDMLCIILSSNLSLNCFGPPQRSHGNYKSKPFAVI